MGASSSPAEVRPSSHGPLDVARVAENLPFVLRTFLGLTVLVLGANIIGVVVVGLTAFATNATATGAQREALLISAVVVVAVQVVIGMTICLWVYRRTLRWLLRGEPPTREDAALALRMPFDEAVLTIVLWLLGDVAMAVVSSVIGLDARTVLAISGGTALAGLAAAGITYLLVARVSNPVARLALASQPPHDLPVFGMRWRLFMIWLLTSAAPVVGIVLLMEAPHNRQNVRGAAVLVCGVALVLGAGATLLTARSIGNPLRGMVDALARVGDGELDVAVPVEDSGEIGLVQTGFNQMVDGLRERERIQDLFGRHVGPAVAAEAIRGGVTLRGQSLDVVALFVDIAGSTRLTRELEPAEFVKTLNRFFEVVVNEVEHAGGLVNKFEGDAALCVFGAPSPLDDPASCALRAARAIRDRVQVMGELDVGIGVASGPVIAGQIGTATRLEYTVIGDAVNEAARLTELAKRADGRILASAETFDAAAPEEREHWIAGRAVRLRGRDVPTNTYRTVTSLDESPSLARRLTDAARAVADFPTSAR